MALTTSATLIVLFIALVRCTLVLTDASAGFNEINKIIKPEMGNGTEVSPVGQASQPLETVGGVQEASGDVELNKESESLLGEMGSDAANPSETGSNGYSEQQASQEMSQMIAEMEREFADIGEAAVPLGPVPDPNGQPLFNDDIELTEPQPSARLDDVAEKPQAPPLEEKLPLERSLRKLKRRARRRMKKTLERAGGRGRHLKRRGERRLHRPAAHRVFQRRSKGKKKGRGKKGRGGGRNGKRKGKHNRGGKIKKTVPEEDE